MARISELILASGSDTRRRMLEAAGVLFRVIVSDLDEAPVKRAAMARGDTAAACAAELALKKALEVSAAEPHCTVIGADQMLELDGLWFDKPADVEAARDQLNQLRGKTHSSHSAVALVRDGIPVWRFVDTARLTMRAWPESFLDHYLTQAGDAVTRSVGCYQIEGVGLQLFDRIIGDHATIMGLPMLPLLAALRHEKLLPS